MKNFTTSLTPSPRLWCTGKLRSTSKKFNIKNTLIALACTLVFAQANAMEKNSFADLSIDEIFAQLSIEDAQSSDQIIFIKQKVINEIKTSIKKSFTLDNEGSILESSDKSPEGYLSQLDDIIIIKNQILEARERLLDSEFANEELSILQKPLNSAKALLAFVKLNLLKISIAMDAQRVLDFLIPEIPQYFINLTNLINQAEEEDAQECLKYLSIKSAEAKSKSKRRIDEVQGDIASQFQEKRHS